MIYSFNYELFRSMLFTFQISRDISVINFQFNSAVVRKHTLYYLKFTEKAYGPAYGLL